MLPAAGRGAVHFPTRTVLAGTARFQFVCTSGTFADATEVSFPVFTPATSEAFATYGDVADADEVYLQNCAK